MQLNGIGCRQKKEKKLEVRNMETHEQAVKRGGKSRASGATFEKRVRLDLEEKGWIVSKWQNNVELPILKYDLKGQLLETSFKFGKLVPAKNKFRGKGIPMMLGSGFPDFIAFRMHIKGEDIGAGLRINTLYKVIGVEVKTNGTLDKEEKEKCQWLLKNNIFSSITVAKKTKVKNRIVIEYKEFEVKNE